MSIIERAIESRGDSQRQAQPKAPGNRPAARQLAEKWQRTNQSVNFDALRDAGLLADGKDGQRITDQLRRIKRPILQNAFGELAHSNGNIIMVTSASPGAGKTFTSIHLAQTLSMDRDRSVLLIDADNTKGTLTSALGLNDEPGLFDALDVSLNSLEQIILPTELPGLKFIPTGRRHFQSEEILTSRHANTALRNLGRNDPHRIIVLDAPPVLPSPDAQALSEIAGQVLLVVAAGETDQDSLKRTVELLDDGKPIGIVLNQAPVNSWLPDYRGEGYAAYER